MRRPVLVEVRSRELRISASRIQPEYWRPRTSGIRHRIVKQKRSRTTDKSKQCDKGLS